MAQRPRATENVVPLFGADDAYEVEDVAWGRSILPAAPAAPAVGSVPDLNGKPKILMARTSGRGGLVRVLVQTTNIRPLWQTAWAGFRSGSRAPNPGGRDAPADDRERPPSAVGRRQHAQDIGCSTG